MKPSLVILANEFSVCRLDPNADYIPDFSNWFLSITKTEDELSVVCEESKAPPGSRSEPGWKCLKVEGPLDFGLTGILSGISGVLAGNEISIFAVSTFDTDYILLKKHSLSLAIKALKNAGYPVSENPGEQS